MEAAGDHYVMTLPKKKEDKEVLLSGFIELSMVIMFRDLSNSNMNSFKAI